MEIKGEPFQKIDLRLKVKEFITNGRYVRSVADFVMQASGNLVEVDILELSRFPCRGVDIFCTIIRLVLLMMKEIDLKLTQGMAEGQ